VSTTSIHHTGQTPNTAIVTLWRVLHIAISAKAHCPSGGHWLIVIGKIPASVLFVYFVASELVQSLDSHKARVVNRTQDAVGLMSLVYQYR
jgi:hypothetical protein